MTPEDKQSRLKELSKPGMILSDQEYEEKERLEEELNILHQEETESFKETNVNLGNGKIISLPEKKKKRSLLSIVLQKIKKKPATWDEIQQLKLEKQKAVLKRDISVANYQRKNPGGKPKQSKISSKNNEIEKEFRSSSSDFRDMSGTNNKNKYKGLIG